PRPGLWRTGTVMWALLLPRLMMSGPPANEPKAGAPVATWAEERREKRRQKRKKKQIPRPPQRTRNDNPEILCVERDMRNYRAGLKPSTYSEGTWRKTGVEGGG